MAQGNSRFETRFALVALPLFGIAACIALWAVASTTIPLKDSQVPVQASDFGAAQPSRSASGFGWAQPQCFGLKRVRP